MSPYVIKKRKLFGKKQSRTPRRPIVRWVGLGVLILLAAFSAVWLWARDVVPEYTGSEVEWAKQWRALYKGVEYTSKRTLSPRPLRIHALRIDLQDPDVNLLVTPTNGEKDGEATSSTTSQFLENNKCQIAVNGSMFEPAARFSGKPMEILGLSISGGVKYSSSANNLHCIGFTKDKVPHYGTPDIEEDVDIEHGLGGLWMVLRDGEPFDNQQRNLDPRTVIGTSRDGRFLFLVVVDGRQPGFSEGLYPLEAGHLMKELGAWNALNLDGGGSSTLVFENKLGNGTVVNRPCSPYFKGIQRPVANHLGILAKPLQRGGQSTPIFE